MSMSSTESLAQDTKDLEENNEETHPKEKNNENMDNIELNENMDTKDFLSFEVNAEKEKSDVEDSDEEKNPKTKKTVVVVMAPPSSDSGIVSDILRSKKEVKWSRVLLGLRISAFVFCLVSFSVLAANEQKVLVEKKMTDWYDFDREYSLKTVYFFRWYEYSEFRYSFTANVVRFVYSALQICDLLRYLITKKHTLDPKLQGYFNVAIDQALAYVLMSASSTSAAAANIYRSSWGEYGADKFTEMASASVAMSFFAFLAFALTSIVSGFILSRLT